MKRVLNPVRVWASRKESVLAFILALLARARLARARLARAGSGSGSAGFGSAGSITFSNKLFRKSFPNKLSRRSFTSLPHTFFCMMTRDTSDTCRLAGFSLIT